MRKLSQSAKDRVDRTLRRKTSATNYNRRDDSSGPITRRRSDSKNSTTGNYPPDTPFDTVSSDLSNGLSISYDVASITSESYTIPPTRDASPEGVAPTVPESLVRGITLTKITTANKQDKLFFLDADGSRVFWRAGVRMKSLLIDNIKSIRSGEETANTQYQLKQEGLDQDCWFTINYVPSKDSRQLKTLHLVAKSKNDLCLWVETLEALSKHREDMMTGMSGNSEREDVIRMHWDSEMAKRKEQNSVAALDLAAVEALCRKLHIHCPRTVIVTNFQLADVSQTKQLDYEQFKSFLKRLRERKDLRKLFNSMKRDNESGISKTRFLSFLGDTQGVDLSSETKRMAWLAKIEARVAESLGEEVARQSDTTIDYETFLAFMLSTDTYTYSKEPPEPKFDRPINEYFISTSHNTYLTGWQIRGQSSSEAYSAAIRKGCRCVEIDCWDGPDGWPRVTHGHTNTTSIPFSDCVNAINQCAFDVSPYPLILSLEVHCNVEQQQRMVSIMMHVFGEEKLLMYPLHDTGNKLPTPEELKYRVLVKVKATEAKPKLSMPIDTIPTSRSRSASSPYPRPIYPTNNVVQIPLTSSGSSMISPPDTIYSPTDRSMTTTSASSGEESDLQMAALSMADKRPQAIRTSRITPMLADLGVYLQGYTFTGPAALSFHQFNHIFSLNENRAMALCHNPDDKAAFEDHNVNYMSRVYPKQTRFSSSNFDPNTFWRRGVQMVALNWQTYDMHMQMNAAMFAAGTDQFGYVLKPDYLRRVRMKVGDFAHRVKLPRYQVKFSVEVISAQQLPRLPSMGKNETINPFIEVQMWSAEDKARGIANGTGGRDTSTSNGFHGIGFPYSRQSNITVGNGYDPQFHEPFELSLQTKYPELVFVRFIVYSSLDGRTRNKSKQLAVFTAKLDSLQKGYRHLPLFNDKGEEFIFSTLFCKIVKQKPAFLTTSLQDISERSPRPSLFRGMLSRTNSAERGRERLTSLEEERTARQQKLNQEIEERISRKEGEFGVL